MDKTCVSLFVLYIIRLVRYIVNDLEGYFLDHINSIIAGNLKQIREQRKISLDAVSKLSGVSKSMLGQIERGEVNPTISTVWKIANGLKISFSTLINRPEADYEVVRLASIQPLFEDQGHYRNYPVFSFDDKRRFEVYYIELDVGAHLDATPHPNGTQEFITVFSGELSVLVNQQTLTAAAGDSIRFKADASHQYRNIGRDLCKVSMIIYYPE